MKTLHSFSGDLYRDNGNLSETRLTLVRENYDKPHRIIETVSDVKSALRYGNYSDVGGYPLFFITSDGSALSFESARDNFYQVCYSIKHDINDGWKITGVDINYEDNDLYCEHSGEKIDCAYGD